MSFEGALARQITFGTLLETNLEKEVTSAKHASRTSKMDPRPPDQFRYTFEDSLEKEMTSAKHASQTSKIEFEREPSTPYQFRCTFEDKLGEENDQRQSRKPKLEHGTWKRPEPA